MKPTHLLDGVRREATILAILSLLLLSSGCSRRIYDVVYPTLSDGKYDTEFPYKNCSTQLEEIARTIKRVNHIAHYKGYLFSRDQGLKIGDLSQIKLKDVARSEWIYHQTGSGTATVIYAADHRLALLTCAHIVAAPDTVITYYQESAADNGLIVQSVSIKQRQSDYVVDIPDGSDMQILALDAKKDIAIIGKTQHQAGNMPLPIFSYPAGQAEKLEWGSFVYVMGFPMGNKMITRGIVSNPRNDPSGSFLVDALFNRGFSGGLVLAIKDGVPNFELVGMAKSVSANSEYVLRPEKTVDEFAYDPNLAYTGDIHVEMKREINYGITHALSMEAIRGFFKENDRALRRSGFYFKAFLEEDGSK